MTREELRKLSRKDLAKILTEITQENERLRLDLEQARLELDDHSTGLSDPGDMAQAARLITDILEKVQESASAYMETIRKHNAAQQRACIRMELNARKACLQKKQEARAQVNEYLKQLSSSLREVSDSYPWGEEAPEVETTE